jgi:hypothetical protein
MSEPGRLRTILFALLGLTLVVLTIATLRGSQVLGWASVVLCLSSLGVYLAWRRALRDERRRLSSAE